MQLAHYLSIIHRSQCELADAFATVADAYTKEPEIERSTRRFEARCRANAARVEPLARKYGEQAGDEPDDLHSDLFHGPRSGPLGLLRDLHDLYLVTSECDIVWTLIEQAAQGARDDELLAVVGICASETQAQKKWCGTQLRQRAPQVLVVV